MTSLTIPSVSQYRYDTVKEFQTSLGILAEQYRLKIKKNTNEELTSLT